MQFLPTLYISQIERPHKMQSYAEASVGVCNSTALSIGNLVEGFIARTHSLPYDTIRYWDLRAGKSQLTLSQGTEN